MSFSRPPPLQIAVHEAGRAYAFASIVWGEFPVEIGIETLDGKHRGWSRRLRVTETEGADVVVARCGDEGSRRWIAAAEAAIALAGPLSEARQRERSSAAGLVFLGLALPQLLDPSEPPVDTDFQHVRRMAGIVDPAAPLAAARGLLVQINGILEPCWPGLRRLARRVLTERCLDRDALRAHFARWPAVAPRGVRTRSPGPAARSAPTTTI